ncbi:MAG: phage tail protein [Streptosporangiaceae bacterium]
MANPFVAEIRIFPFNFAPRGWAFCNGQLLPLSQNTALFSLLGTTFGGNGVTTFGLPNLQGASPVHPGQGPGLSLYDLGDTGGSQTVALLPGETASHSHTMQADARPGDLDTPSPQASLARSSPQSIYKTPTGATTQPMAAGILGGAVGGNAPHNNLMPYLTLNFCIALQGVYPPRS